MSAQSCSGSSFDEPYCTRIKRDINLNNFTLVMTETWLTYDRGGFVLTLRSDQHIKNGWEVGIPVYQGYADIKVEPWASVYLNVTDGYLKFGNVSYNSEISANGEVVFGFNCQFITGVDMNALLQNESSVMVTFDGKSEAAKWDLVLLNVPE
ncbi:hypothetical protein HK098_005694 [Nowakowskiella sp. JEL0407]|nr:hypothetical protein HK098_005694 [Nowakowskiella sp. JEL0407]